VLEALARGYLRADRLLDAMQACDLWITQQPDHPWPWLWRGGIYEQLANFDQALTDYQRAMEIAPEDKDVRLSLGTLLSRGRRPGPAAEHFEHILERFPDDQEALLGLAGCRIEQGKTEDAVPLLQRVLASDPSAARALVLLGKVALEQRDPTGAEKWLLQATGQAPGNSEAFHQLILALRTQGKDAEADRLAPRLEAIRQDIDRLDRLIRTIARNPEDATLRHEAGVIALRLGRQDDGVHWLQSVLRLPGDHRPSHAALAEHFAQQDDPRAELHRRLAQTTE
jgi:tetratricopeptide (TPR) repeat protein